MSEPALLSHKVLTFDVEEWFNLIGVASSDEALWESYESRIEQSVETLLHLCRRMNVKATFFILGWIADRYPAVVRSIADDGHHVGCHSYAHKPVWAQTKKEFEADLVLALTAIERAIGQRPTSYRAPGFSLTRHCAWAFEILYRNGIRVDASLFTGKHAHGGWEDNTINGPLRIHLPNGTTMKEYPFITTELVRGINLPVLGGGYFRMFPFIFIKRAINQSNYAMTYFHPRDFDKNQPILPDLTFTRKLKGYVGIQRALKKVEKLLLQNEFKSINDLDKELEWDDLPVLLLN